MSPSQSSLRTLQRRLPTRFLKNHSSFALVLVFLIALVALFVYAVSVAEFVMTIPAGAARFNFTGTIRLQANLSLPTTAILGFNITNASFYAVVPGNETSTGWRLIGHNTTANLSQYTIRWNTNSGNFPDNLTYSVFINASATNASDGTQIVLDSAIATNVGVDNTPPTVTYVGSNPSVNPGAADYINTTRAISFNFTVFDNLFPILDGLCQVRMDFGNGTQGANVTSTFLSDSNGTSYFNLTVELGTAMEGEHQYRVQCAQDYSTNLTGNSTTRTFVVDLSRPMINLTLHDFNDLEKTQFAPSADVTIRCARADSISGFNKTEILVQAPFDAGLISKYVDYSSVDRRTSLVSFDYILPSIDTGELGTYLTECRATDRAGNLLRINKTFDIVKQPPRSTSAYAVPGFKEPISKTIIGVGGTSDVGELTSDGVARLMAETAIVLMTINGEKHAFTVKEVGEGYAMLEVASEPFGVRVNEGETKEVDVNADGLNDITVNLNMIYKNKADLVFNLLTTPTPSAPPAQPPAAPPSGEPPGPVARGFSWAWIFTILIIVVLIVFVALHYMRKRGEGGEERGDIKFTPKDLGMAREQEEVPFGGYGGLRRPPQQPGQQRPPQGQNNRSFY